MLLALLDLAPTTPWSAASQPLRRVTEIIDWIREYYGRSYAPNTRETIRDETLAVMVQEGLVLKNADEPDRPTTSPSTCYCIEPGALALVRTHGTEAWQAGLSIYRATRTTLAERYTHERSRRRIPVRTPAGQRFELSAGAHNELIREIVESFAPRWTPGGTVIYVGDTAAKFVFSEPEGWQALGLRPIESSKMPDVIIHHVDEDRLVLVEAVTSHGPIDRRRRRDLEELFQAGKAAALVFVTAFQTLDDLARYLNQISWETEVWVAEAPDHLIHFDGEHFLGPCPRPI